MSSAPMTTREIDRLAKVLARLSSSFDGEVVAAARLADNILRSHDLRFGDLVPTPDRLVCAAGIPDLADIASWALREHHDDLSDWERAFCRSVAGRRRLSRKQAAVLYRIRGRLDR